MNDWLERKRSRPNPDYIPHLLLDTEKSYKKPDNSQCPDQGSNQILSEYGSR
jgi:hypothetical protein